MIKVLFICLGNICRSPMAEFVFKDMVSKRGLSEKFLIESAATSREAVGEGIYYGTRDILKEKGIPFTQHISRQMTKEDYKKFDYILGMEEKNIKNIMTIIGEDKENKVYRLLDFSENPRNIIDPWYYGNFDSTYYDIEEGCNKFLEYLSKNKYIWIWQKRKNTVK